MLDFWGRSQQPKWNKNYFFAFINDKTQFIPSSEMKCPKSAIFTKKIIGWGKSGKVIMQRFGYEFCFRRCLNIFRATLVHPPSKNWPVHLCVWWYVKVTGESGVPTSLIRQYSTALKCGRSEAILALEDCRQQAVISAKQTTATTPVCLLVHAF